VTIKPFILAIAGAAVAVIGVFTSVRLATTEEQRVRLTVKHLREAANRLRDGATSITATDGWGEPILYRCARTETGRVCVVVSAAADHALQPSTRGILAVPETDALPLIHELNALINASGQEVPWSERWKTDIVVWNGTQLSGKEVESSVGLPLDVPPHVVLRCALWFGIPALALFVAAVVVDRRARVTQATTRG
jgi:hypothetical protein